VQQPGLDRERLAHRLRAGVRPDPDAHGARLAGGERRARPGDEHLVGRLDPPAAGPAVHQELVGGLRLAGDVRLDAPGEAGGGGTEPERLADVLGPQVDDAHGDPQGVVKRFKTTLFRWDV
jgi:hypothetical protein